MKRIALQELVDRKNGKHRKPLIIWGRGRSAKRISCRNSSLGLIEEKGRTRDFGAVGQIDAIVADLEA